LLLLDEVVALQTSGPLEYRCHLLDRYGQIVWRSTFRAVTEEEAITTARTFFRPRTDSTCVFELWQEDRFVYCESDPLVLDFGTGDKATTSLARRAFGWASRVIAHV
jgi:hypothetical protein